MNGCHFLKSISKFFKLFIEIGSARNFFLKLNAEILIFHKILDDLGPARDKINTSHLCIYSNNPWLEALEIVAFTTYIRFIPQRRDILHSVFLYIILALAVIFYFNR